VPAQVIDRINVVLMVPPHIVQRTKFGGIGMKFGFLDTYHPKKIV